MMKRYPATHNSLYVCFCLFLCLQGGKWVYKLLVCFWVCCKGSVSMGKFILECFSRKIVCKGVF